MIPVALILVGPRWPASGARCMVDAKTGSHQAIRSARRVLLIFFSSAQGGWDGVVPAALAVRAPFV